MATTAIIREGLYKAKKYYNDLTAYNNDKENLEPPEYDLKSEALIPIITRKQRLIFIVIELMIFSLQFVLQMSLTLI